MAWLKLNKLEDKVWGVNTLNSYKKANSDFLIYSSENKGLEIDNLLNKIDFNYHTNFIIFGIKNVELISRIYKNKTPFSTLVVIEICENNSIELECDENQLSFLYDKTVDVLIGSKTELIGQLKKSLSHTLKLFNLRNTKIITIPYTKSVYPKEIEELIKISMESLSTSISSFGNDIQDILMGMDNYINNWKHTFRGTEFKYFENLYKEKPAVIIGAGPSLDKSIEQIKYLKGKALILCVDAAMDVLLDEGIVPDIVATIERTECTVRLYQREKIPQEIVYVGANQVPGAILNRMSRIVFTGRTGDALFREFNESIGLTNLNIGNNVSHILISFAQFLGCSKVLFTGLDLAYPEGVTHARRTLDNFTDTMKSGYKNDMVYVKGQKGEMLETQEYFMHTRVWIEDFILKHPDCIYINCSEGGANITGAKNMRMSDAINEYCINSSIPSMTAFYDDISSKNRIDNKSTTKKAIEFFQKLICFYNDILNTAKEYYSILNIEKDYGILPLMEEQRFNIGEKWKEMPAAYFILQSIIIKYQRDIHAFPMYLNREEEIKMKNVNKEFYNLLQVVIERVTKDLKLYIEALESHLQTFEMEGVN